MRAAAAVAVGTTGVQAAQWDPKDFLFMFHYGDNTKCKADTWDTTAAVHIKKYSATSCFMVDDPADSVKISNTKCPADGVVTGGFQNSNAVCASVTPIDTTTNRFHVKTDGVCGASNEDQKGNLTPLDSTKKTQLKCGENLTKLPENFGAILVFSDTACSTLTDVMDFTVRGTTGTGTLTSAASNTLAGSCFPAQTGTIHMAVEECKLGEKIKLVQYATPVLCTGSISAAGTATTAITAGSRSLQFPATVALGGVDINGLKAGECHNKVVSNIATPAADQNIVVLCGGNFAAAAPRGSVAAAFAAAAAWLLF